MPSSAPSGFLPGDGYTASGKGAVKNVYYFNFYIAKTYEALQYDSAAPHKLYISKHHNCRCLPAAFFNSLDSIDQIWGQPERPLAISSSVGI